MSWPNLLYLVASVLFILGIKGLTHPRTAVRGNLMSAAGMLLAIAATVFLTTFSVWIVGAGLVVLGIVLYSVSVSLSYTGSTPSTDVGSLVISQLGWMLAGPMITIGLATLVGLLFLTALAGRRTRRPTYGEDVAADVRAGEDDGFLR